MKTLLAIIVLIVTYCCGEEGYFWHLTDFHWDFSYWSDELSCNGYFWHLTDFHWDFSYWSDELSCNGKNVSNRGAFGNYWCDSPWTLVENAVKGVKKIRPDIDFILWTGDTIPHINAANLSTDINIELIRNVTYLIQEQFPSVPVYATLGNNDYYPKNQFPPHTNEIYNATYRLWETWINDSSQEKFFLKGGYYTVKTQYGLRILVLNTNFYYKDEITKDIDDPSDQFAWLDAQLSDAASRKEKVLITGHVPPGFSTPRGISFMAPNFNRKFVEIVLRHSDVITALHFGHEHRDTFKVFQNSSGLPVVSLFVSPSVTPWRYVRPTETADPHNPAVRLIKYDRLTGRHLDLFQYYVDLPTANHDRQLTWLLGYTTTGDYGIPDITASSLSDLVNKFRNPKSEYFQKYMILYNTNATLNQFCGDQCHKTVLCGFYNLIVEEFKRCLSKVQNCHDPSCIIVGK